MGQVISDQFVQNAIALGDKWRQQRQDGRIRNAMANYGTDPTGTIQQVMQIDPTTGFKMQQLADTHATSQQDLGDKQRTDRLANLKTVVGVLDGANKASGGNPQDIGSTFDQVAPVLQHSLGMSDEDIKYYRGALTANPNLINVLKQRLDPEKPILSTPGSDLLAQDGTVLHSTPAVDRGQVVQVKRGDGGTDVYTYDPIRKSFINLGQQADGGTGGGAAPSGPLTAADAWQMIRHNEGNTLVQNDGNGHPAKFGFNQKWNPDINVADLTEESAADRYAKTRFPAEVANMPRPLALAYADTMFMNPGKAKQFLNDSGGDANKFMDLREAWLARQPNAAQYDARNQYVRQQMGLGGSSAPAAPTPTITTPGKPAPPQAAQLSDAEVSSRGLDPSYQWQKMPTGEVKIIGPAHKVGVGGKDTAMSPASVAMVNGQLDNTIHTIDELATHPGLPRITGIMGSFPDIPGGHAADADALLTTLKSQIGLNVLQALRQTSKTGGALGRVSNFEMQTLQENMAALKKSQSLDQFKGQLTLLKSNLNNIKTELSQAAQQDAQAKANSGGGGTQVNIPAGAIEFLKKNPSGAVRLQFDNKYGKGASRKLLGTANITADMPIGEKTPYGTRI